MIGCRRPSRLYEEQTRIRVKEYVLINMVMDAIKRKGSPSP